MKVKTAKQDVTPEGEHVADPSSAESVKEIDFDTMSEDELRDFAQKEHQAKLDAVANLRKKEEKVQKRKEEEILDDDLDDDKEIDELIQSKVQKVLEDSRKKEYSNGAKNWLLSQPWAESLNSNTPEADQLYAKVFAQAKQLQETNTVESKEDFRNLLAKAMVVVTGSTAPLEIKNNSRGEYRRIISTGVNTSSAKNGSTEPKLSERARELARQAGHSIDEVKEYYN